MIERYTAFREVGQTNNNMGILKDQVESINNTRKTKKDIFFEQLGTRIAMELKEMYEYDNFETVEEKAYKFLKEWKSKED